MITVPLAVMMWPVSVLGTEPGYGTTGGVDGPTPVPWTCVPSQVISVVTHVQYAGSSAMPDWILSSLRAAPCVPSLRWMIGAFCFIPLDSIFTVSVPDSAAISMPLLDIVITFWLLSLIVILASAPAPLITMVWVTEPSRVLLRIVT